MFKKKWLFLLFAPVLIVGYFCYNYLNLDIYTYHLDESILSNGKMEFTRVVGIDQDELYNYKGEKNFTIGNQIGRTNNSTLFGFKEMVYRIEGKPNLIFIRGLMSEGVFIKK